MSRENVLVLIAILTALTPFSGLPLSWLSFILPAFGVMIAGIALSLRARRVRATPAHEASQS